MMDERVAKSVVATKSQVSKTRSSAPSQLFCGFLPFNNVAGS